MTRLGAAESGLFDVSSAEIAAYHPGSRGILVTNGAIGLECWGLPEAGAPDGGEAPGPGGAAGADRPGTQAAGQLVPERRWLRRQGGVTSVAVHGDLVALAAAGPTAGAPGLIRFFTPDGKDLGRVRTPPGPDMVTFTPDGSLLLVALEGEPSPDGSVDPEGGVGIVDLRAGVANASLRVLGFQAFESQRPELERRGLRVVTPGATLAQDAEPEYIAVAPDGTRAFVTLQENNAVAVVDLARQEVESIQPLGFRDALRPGHGLDASDSDGRAEPRPWPVLLMPQPDAVAAFQADGATWLLTADEGEPRTGAFNEVISLQQALAMRASGAPMGAAELAAAAAGGAGHLQVSCVPAPASAGGGICAFGTRGASLWKVAADGSLTLAWESGDAFERIMAARWPDAFNEDHHPGRREARSTVRGPEPEGVALGEAGGRRLAFVTLERPGAVVVLDVTSPPEVRVVGACSGRTPGAELRPPERKGQEPPEWRKAGDLGPEGVLFIPAAISPTHEDLLVVCNEVSGTTALWRVQAAPLR